MVFPCNRKLAGVMLTLAVFLSVYTPTSQASIDSHIMSSGFPAGLASPLPHMTGVTPDTFLDKTVFSGQDSHQAGKRTILPAQNIPHKRTTQTAGISHHRPSKSLHAKDNIRPNNYGKVSGPSLSEPEVRQVLERAGFPAKTISTMLQIAGCESSFSATAENVNRDGSIDVGLLQINERNWRECHVSKTELSDPNNNARCAYQIWQRQGYNAWGCCFNHI
jgi:hypothetical protein